MSISIFPIYFFDNYPDSWEQGLFTFYEVTFRPVFIFGLMCVIYPVLVGRGRVLLCILGHPIFNPMAKLTYGAYLFHVGFSWIMTGGAPNGHYTSFTWIWLSFFTLYTTSYLASFFMTLIFESPMMQLLRAFLEGARKPQIKEGQLLKKAIN